MHYRKAIVSLAILSFLAVGCVPKLRPYTHRPSTLNYLMEPKSDIYKSEKKVWVEVNDFDTLVGEVEEVDSRFLYAVFYMSDRIHELYHLDTGGIREIPHLWVKEAFEREISRNSIYDVASQKEAADYVIQLNIDSLSSNSQLFTLSRELIVPLFVYGIVFIPIEVRHEVPGGHAETHLNYRMLNQNGEVIQESQFSSYVDTHSSDDLKVPLIPPYIYRNCNANAVEILSRSFRSNFEQIIAELNSGVDSKG